MQVSVENVGKLERRLTVSLPAEDLEGEVGARLRKIARTTRLKGFRPGKVPAKVVEQRYGQQVRNEVLSELIGRSFNAALERENLRPAGSPDIQTDGEANDGELRFVATFEITPDFGTIDVSGLKVTRIEAEVGEADVDEMIETLRQQRIHWEPVERAARKGDRVSLEMVADAEGRRVPASGEDHGVTVLGSGMMLPSIETALEGAAEGETREVEVDFPGEWHVAELAGRHARVDLKVTAVAEQRLPDVDAAFVESFGIHGGDLDTFRREVRANLERELRGTLMNRLRGEVIDTLVAAYADTELPPRLIQAEAQALAAQAGRQAREQGRENAEFNEGDFLAQARHRVAAGLLVGELARQNDLRLDPRRLNETLRLIASTYEDPQQVIDMYREDQRMMQGLQSRVMEEQVIDWIAEHADVTRQQLGFTDVMRPDR